MTKKVYLYNRSQCQNKGTLMAFLTNQITLFQYRIGRCATLKFLYDIDSRIVNLGPCSHARSTIASSLNPSSNFFTFSDLWFSESWSRKSCPLECRSSWPCSIRRWTRARWSTTSRSRGNDTMQFRSLLASSVTRKKSPNGYESCPKMTSLQKWQILSPL